MGAIIGYFAVKTSYPGLFPSYQYPPPHTTSTRSLIYKYAHTGDVQSLKNLNHSSQSLDALDAKGNSPLCEAVWRQDKTAVTALVQAGANSNHACMQKIPESYKTAAGLKAATTVSATGLSTGAVVGIGVGAAALIGGGVALAAGGGGGGGSHKDACEGIVCDGENQHCSAGACVCNAGFTMFDGVCYETLACVNGAQNANVCVCQPGYAGALCNTCDTGYINQNGVCYVELTCDANQHQETNACVCDTGYGFYGTAECHPTLACKDGTQQGDICICNGHASGALCDTCEAGYGFHGTNACHADLACINGTQTADACVCSTLGWTGLLCDTPASCDGYDYETCPTGYAPSATCLSGETTKLQCNTCAEGYGKYGTNTCHLTLSCDDNQHQQGDTCVCNPGYELQGGVCTFTSCPANQYKNGSECLSCPANSTSPAGSTNINQCICNSGYTKSAANVCVSNQANIAGSDYVYKLGTDTGYKVYNNNEDIDLSVTGVGKTDGEGLLTAWEGGTIINNANITASTSSLNILSAIWLAEVGGDFINNGTIVFNNSAFAAEMSVIEAYHGGHTIINNGIVRSDVHDGILVGFTYDDLPVGDNFVENNGYIATRLQGIDARLSDGNISIINNGSIFATEDFSQYSPSDFDLSLTDWAGISVTDALKYDSGYEKEEKTEGAAVHIQNSGTINTAYRAGIRLSDAIASDVEIINDDLGFILAANGIYVRSNSLPTPTQEHSLHIVNSGDIYAEVGILVFDSYYTPKIENKGYILANGGIVLASNYTGTISNTGIIEGTFEFYGDQFEEQGGIYNLSNSNVINSGEINLTRGTGVDNIGGDVINDGTITIEEGTGIFSRGNVINSGFITFNDENVFSRSSAKENYGIEIKDSGNILNNTGKITFNLSGTREVENNFQGVTAIGIVTDAATVYNSGSIVINDTITTKTTGDTPSLIGIKATNGATVYNTSTGVIEINSVNAEFVNIFGIYADNSRVENYGQIIVNNESDQFLSEYGIYATGENSVVYNAGTIKLKGEIKTGEEATYCANHACYHYNGAYYKTKVSTGSGEDDWIGEDYYGLSANQIVLKDGATLATSGTLSSTGVLSMASFSPDGTGTVTALPGAKLSSPVAIKDDLHISNDFVTNGFNTTYTANGLIDTPDTTGLNLISNSALFNASLAENGSDVVMQMKSFDELTDNKSLAAFLANNYAGQKNEAFFNELKSIGSAEAFTSALTHLTAGETLTRFTHEDLTALRDVNANMNALMFSNMDQPLFQNAGTFNAFSFQNDRQSSAQFALAHKRISPYTKIGYAMSTTHLNSDNRRSTTRQNDIFQAFTPIGYDRFGWQLISTPQIGFARAHYSRKGYNGTSYDGIIEKRIAGLMNEARYPIQIGSVTLAPTVEFNALFYNQKGNETKKAYSLTMPSDNTLSVEAGAGFHLETKIKGFSLTAGAMLYHELADPYNMKVGMNGMDGSFDLFDEQKKYRGVADLGFGYDVGPFNVYGNLRHFVETQNRTQMKAGLNIHF